MEPLLIVILSGLVLIMFIDISIKCINRNKSIGVVGAKAYSIKKPIPYLQIENGVFFIIAVWSAYSYARTEDKDYVYAVHGVVEFFNRQDVFMRWVYALYIITIVVMFINFTLSLFLQDEIYSEGILTAKSKFIYFDNISGISLRNSMLPYRKNLDIYVDNKKIDTIKINNNEVSKVVNIISLYIKSVSNEDKLAMK